MDKFSPPPTPSLAARATVRFMLVISIALVLGLLVVTLVLIAQLWRSVGTSEYLASMASSLATNLSITAAAESAASAVPPPAAPSASAPSSTGAPAGSPGVEAKDAVANAMTAIGTAVAVVALVLSVGTSWFAEQLRRVENVERTMRRRDTRREAAWKAERLLAQREREVGEALPAAKAALWDWFGRRGAKDPAQMAQEYSLWLDTLAASDSDLRFKAFHQLLPVLWSRSRIRDGKLDPTLRAIEDLCQRCHDLALVRLRGRDGVDLLKEVEQGLWCKVFDPIEQARYRKRMRGS